MQLENEFYLCKAWRRGCLESGLKCDVAHTKLWKVFDFHFRVESSIFCDPSLIPYSNICFKREVAIRTCSVANDLTLFEARTNVNVTN